MKVPPKPALHCSIEVINCIYTMMYITDNRDKTIIWCNRNMVNETGYTPEEVENMDIEFFKTVRVPIQSKKWHVSSSEKLIRG